MPSDEEIAKIVGSAKKARTFGIPFVQAMIKLRNSHKLNEICVLSSQESKAVLDAFQALKRKIEEG